MQNLPSFFEDRIIKELVIENDKKHTLKVKEGDVYNNFTVTSKPFLNIRCSIDKKSYEKRKTRSEWYINVDCSCGNNLWVKYKYLLTLKFKCCKECRAKVREGKYKDLQGMRVWHTRCYQIKKSAKNQNIPFNLTPEYLKNLAEEQKYLCGITGEPIMDVKGNMSLDKKDPHLGYIQGNVQWTIKRHNMMKQDLSMEELVKWCKKVIGKWETL